MNDDIIKVLVGRCDTRIGGFYLSFVELCIKDGRFRPDDWGWIDGMSDWEPLEAVLINARRLVGKKCLATTGQRNCLSQMGFELWKGISNREASAAVSSSWEARLAPSGWWIGDPITEEQIKWLREIGIQYRPPEATPKQIAYLSFMGVENANELTALAASNLIDTLFEGLPSDAGSTQRRRQAEWHLERCVKHPAIYARELTRHFEEIMVERGEMLHNYVRSKLTEGSDRLTKKKIRTTMDSLQNDSPEWWQSANSKKVFLERLAKLFPNCVDGEQKTLEE